MVCIAISRTEKAFAPCLPDPRSCCPIRTSTIQPTCECCPLLLLLARLALPAVLFINYLPGQVHGLKSFGTSHKARLALVQLL